MSLFFICSFSFLIKKLQKRERTCRAYMKVLEQCFCPLCLLPSSPLFLCYCISSAACTLCTVMYCLLPVLPVFWVIALHTDTIVPKVLSKVKEESSPITEMASLYGCVSVFFPSLYALTAMVYFVFHSVFPRCMFSKCLLKIARLWCITPQLKHPVLSSLSLFICWRIYDVTFFFAFIRELHSI